MQRAVPWKMGFSALCVFDLNNLRRINNNLGHDKGDEYIRSFAVQLRGAVPPEQFVGRDGGDEFLVILRGLDGKGVRMCLQIFRERTEEVFKGTPGDADQLCRRLCDGAGF